MVIEIDPKIAEELFQAVGQILAKHRVEPDEEGIFYVGAVMGMLARNVDDHNQSADALRAISDVAQQVYDNATAAMIVQ